MNKTLLETYNDEMKKYNKILKNYLNTLEKIKVSIYKPINTYQGNNDFIKKMHNMIASYITDEINKKAKVSKDLIYTITILNLIKPILNDATVKLVYTCLEKIPIPISFQDILNVTVSTIPFDDIVNAVGYKVTMFSTLDTVGFQKQVDFLNNPKQLTLLKIKYSIENGYKEFVPVKVTELFTDVYINIRLKTSFFEKVKLAQIKDAKDVSRPSSTLNSALNITRMKLDFRERVRERPGLLQSEKDLLKQLPITLANVSLKPTTTAPTAKPSTTAPTSTTAKPSPISTTAKPSPNIPTIKPPSPVDKRFIVNSEVSNIPTLQPTIPQKSVFLKVSRNIASLRPLDQVVELKYTLPTFEQFGKIHMNPIIGNWASRSKIDTRSKRDWIVTRPNQPNQPIKGTCENNNGEKVCIVTDWLEDAVKKQLGMTKVKATIKVLFARSNVISGDCRIELVQLGKNYLGIETYKKYARCMIEVTAVVNSATTSYLFGFCSKSEFYPNGLVANVSVFRVGLAGMPGMAGGGHTVRELRIMARKLGIVNRSKMNKEELMRVCIRK